MSTQQVNIKSSNRNSWSTIQRAMISAANAIDNLKNDGEYSATDLNKALRHVLSVKDMADAAWKQRVI